MSRLTDRLPAGDRILLDSSVLAAYFDGGERTSALAAELVDEHVRSGRNPAVVSMVSVMETLIRPLRRLPAAHATVLSFFRDMPNLSTAPVDLDVARRPRRCESPLAWPRPTRSSPRPGLPPGSRISSRTIGHGAPGWSRFAIARRS